MIWRRRLKRRSPHKTSNQLQRRGGSMSSNIQTQATLFSFDGQGRWLCNTLSEALWSAGIATDPAFGSPPTDARPFDVIIVGGGTFGSVLGQHLLANDKTNSRRILVLDAGPYSLPEHEQNM